MPRFGDLENFETAVDAFVGDGDNAGADRWADMPYSPKLGEAEVHLHERGEQSPVEVWTLATPELTALRAAVAARYRTDGHFRVVRSYNHWSLSYGPCWYYGGAGHSFARLITDETDQINRLPAGWEPMSAQEIIEMMTED